MANATSEDKRQLKIKTGVVKRYVISKLRNKVIYLL